MSNTKDSNQKPRYRANFGLKPEDMTPEQRKNWERVEKERKKN
ncbi:MAG: hypothetical protein AAFV07_18365 [Bacteroidota bacterium]